MPPWANLWDTLAAAHPVNVDAAKVIQPGASSETRAQEALLDVQTAMRNAAIRAAHGKGVAIEGICRTFKIPPLAALSILAATAAPVPTADERRRYRELLLSDDPVARHAFRTRVIAVMRERLRCELTKPEARIANLAITVVFHFVDDAGEDE